MTQTTLCIIVGVVNLLLTALAYQYIVHRDEGRCQVKDFLKLKFDCWCMAALIVGFFAAMFVFLRGFLSGEDSLMRAVMNAEVMLWLVILGYIDLKEKIIPNSLIGLGLLFWLALILMDIFLGKTPWLKLLVFSGTGGLICGGVLLLIAIFSKSGLGMGDVKMFFVLGLLYGLADTYGILLFSVIIMGVLSIVLLLLKKVDKKTTIPMAPFVMIGFLLSILAGM